MNNVFNPKIFNEFLKDERKKRNLTIPQLSLMINQSTGYISKLENANDIVYNDKINVLLDVYNYPHDYLIKLDQSIDQYIDEFIDEIIYARDNIDSSFQEIRNFMLDYKGTVFMILYMLVMCLLVFYNLKISLILKVMSII